MENLSQNQDFDDDLQDFQQIQEDKIYQSIMNFKPVLEDDAHQLRNRKDEPKPKDNELTSEQLLARDLKLRNATKYFQLVKLTYLSALVKDIIYTKDIIQDYQKITAQFLSLLSAELIGDFMRLKKAQPLSIKIQEVIYFIKNAKEYIAKSRVECSPTYDIIFWSIFCSLSLGCRRVRFYDLESLVEETFYKLNYISLEKQLKRDTKKTKEQQLMKMQIDIKIEEELKKQGTQFLSFEDFQFNENSFKSIKSKTSQHSQREHDDHHLKARRENNFLRKRNYKQAYFQVFSPAEEKWLLVNSELLEFEEAADFKKYVLAGKTIIGFYSTSILRPKHQYQQLFGYRQLKRILIQDLTLYFYDDLKKLNTRRRRVGVRAIMKEMFKRGSFSHHRFLLSDYNQYTLLRNDEIEFKFQLDNFPKNNKDMLMSDYFAVPSLLPQYCILDPKSKPIGNEFNDEKVYLKKDIVPVTSRMVWIDMNRRVRPNEVPIKKTENRAKKMTELFLYQQTEQYSLSLSPEGNFVPDDQYNSLYVPPQFQPGNLFTIIDKRISGICNKHGIRYVKLVQGFNRSMGRILPNQIGFLVYKQDEARVIELWQERKKKLLENKSASRQNVLMGMWNKLFTKIELREWSHNFQR